MSGKNNVNPGQYKVAGRQKMGDPLGQDADKQKLSASRQKETGAAPKAVKAAGRKKRAK